MNGWLDRNDRTLQHLHLVQSMGLRLDHHQCKYLEGIFVFLIFAAGKKQDILQVKVLYGQVHQKLPQKLPELGIVKTCH